jgi:hypothetical protein
MTVIIYPLKMPVFIIFRIFGWLVNLKVLVDFKYNKNQFHPVQMNKTGIFIDPEFKNNHMLETEMNWDLLDTVRQFMQETITATLSWL